MANQWLRLWHDMPNDPKWRTIARVSKQSISSVIAVYLHVLVIASNAAERGRTQSVCNEDIASALDLECEQVDAIIDAMQGRVLDGDMVSGWSKRQVEREDGAAERAKAWREAQKLAKLQELNADRTQPNAAEREQTPDTDTDTDKEEKEEKERASKPRSYRQKREQVTLREYVDSCKTSGIKPIPDDHSVRTFASDAGITDEMMQVAWTVFKDTYLNTAEREKKYKDWPTTFANNVKGCWQKIWFVEPTGEVKWTSVGLAHKAAIEARMARESA